jgi:2-hydroxy-3-keto-5-methylthiopentenyl-1-phosphate phosphatase
MSAAKHADVLFVKLNENGESDLATYCDQEGIKNIKFKDFSQALPIVNAVVSGAMTVMEALEVGNANGWSSTVAWEV